jgi:hypothetical protein
MKKCLNCDNEVIGRSDKKFCTEKCKNKYNWIKDYSKTLMNVTKKRCEKNNIEFNLDYSDFIIPKKCPVFGTDIIIGVNGRSNNSPSIDRIDNTIGYVKGNTWIVSDKVNRLKSNLSKNELLIFCNKILEKIN